jgi:hypothetical protein
MKLLIMQFFQPSVSVSLLKAHLFLNTLFSETTSPYFCLKNKLKNLQTKIMLFLRGLSFPLRLLCHLDTAKRIAPFNLPSTTPFQDRFFFPLSERLGLNENAFSSFALPFLPPFPSVRPSQTKLHGIYFVFRM